MSSSTGLATACRVRTPEAAKIRRAARTPAEWEAKKPSQAASWSRTAGRADPAPVSTAAVTAPPSCPDRTWGGRHLAILPFPPVAGEDDGGGPDRLHADLLPAPQPPHEGLTDRRPQPPQPEIETEPVGGGEQPRPVDEQRRVVQAG